MGPDDFIRVTVITQAGDNGPSAATFTALQNVVHSAQGGVS